MARFFAEIKGSRGMATRIGTADTGIRGHVRGWHVGAEVTMTAHGGKDATLQDVCEITATDGSAGYARRSIGEVRLIDGELQLQPSSWVIKQCEQFKRRERNEARREARAAAKLTAQRVKDARRKAWRFFHEHAGWSTPPGKAACALSLARAEEVFRALEDAGVARIEWIDDSADADTSWMDARALREWESGDMSCEWARLQVRDQAHEWEEEGWYTVSSLGGIFGADDNYKRVIGAELASEASEDLATIAKRAGVKLATS